MTASASVVGAGGAADDDAALEVLDLCLAAPTMAGATKRLQTVHHRADVDWVPSDGEHAEYRQ